MKPPNEAHTILKLVNTKVGIVAVSLAGKAVVRMTQNNGKRGVGWCCLQLEDNAMEVCSLDWSSDCIERE